MATKWKNFTRNSWVKAVCWLLILAMTGIVAVTGTQLVTYFSRHNAASDMIGYGAFVKEEPSAEYLAMRLYQPIINLYDAAKYGTDEESISKNMSDSDILSNLLDEYCNSGDYPYGSGIGTDTANNPDSGETADALDEETINHLAQEAASVADVDSDDFRSWLTAYPEMYQQCRSTYINNQLSYAKSATDGHIWQDSLGTDGFAYYVSSASSGAVLTSLPSDTTAEDAEASLTGGGYALAYKVENNSVTFEVGAMMDTAAAAEIKQLTNTTTDESTYTLDAPQAGDLAIGAMTNNAYENLLDMWHALHKQCLYVIIALGAWAVVTLLGTIILCCGAGRRQGEDGAYTVFYDRVWSELQYLAFVGVLLLAALDVSVCMDGWNAISSVSPVWLYSLLGGGAVLVVAAFLLLLLSQVRHIKRKNWRHSWILWRAVRGLASWLHAQWKKSPMRRRFLFLSILVPLLCAFVVPAPFVAIILIVGGMRLADSIEAVTNGARDIRAGKTDTQISVNEKTTPKELIGLADDLNGISDGLNEAVQTAVKSERLKSELISNVSHDIKTPLTSIVTYVDLLKGCEIADPAAQEYLAVLEQKTQRLQALTLDLFDASKATSGAMQVDLAKTDLDALLRQALGERSEHIQKAGLDIRISSHPPVYISADGRLLWRVLDNLISNCVRYAVPNSRVYVIIEQEDALCRLTMKNISASELNISADELMQRFTRGDRSRHTEGSGLGLSIAQSLAALMHGSCHVEIDGDLFKAIVEMPMWVEK